MKRYSLLFALFCALTLTFVSPCAFGQTAPLDRSEILGRLALSYSPSYVAYLVKKGGISFGASPDFLSQVKSAGGDGILIERLSGADASSSSATSGEADKPIDHLAKCAELPHTGATEPAESACFAAIDEIPRSPWPLLISAKLVPINPFVQDPSESEKANIARHAALLAQAAALAPDLQVVHFYRSDPIQVTNGSAALDMEQLQSAEVLDSLYSALDYL